MNSSAFLKNFKARVPLLAALSALALIFSLPDLGPWWLFPIGLFAHYIVVYGILRTRKIRAGVSLFVFCAYGIAAAFPFFSFLFVLVIGFLFGALAALMMLLYDEARVGKVSDALLFGVVFALMEFVRTSVLGGVGLGNAYAAPAYAGVFSSLYPLVGVYGVTAIMAFATAFVARLFARGKQEYVLDASRRRALGAMIIVIALGTAFLFRPVAFPRDREGSVRVAAIGHSADSTESAASVEKEYKEGIRSAFERGADVVLLPGHALRFDSAAAREAFAEDASRLEGRIAGRTLVFGVSGDDKTPFSCKGGICARVSTIEFLREGRNVGSGQIISGTWAAYPRRAGVSLIVRPSDDQDIRARYGHAMRLAEDLAHARMLGLPLLRASKGGISAIVSAEGEVIRQIEGTELLTADIRY